MQVVHFLFWLLSWGQLAGAVETPTSVIGVSEASVQKWKYALIVDYQSNLYERDHADFADSSTAVLMIRRNLANKNAISLVTDVTKEFQDEERFDISSASFIYSRRPYDFNHFYVLNSIRWILPVNEQQRDRQGLISGFSIDLTPTFKMENWGLLGWNLSARSRITKNFHEYSVATNGASNIEYAFSERIDLGYSFNETWSVGTTFIYAISQTYKNNRKENFSWAQEVSYQVSQNTELGLGHTNEAGLLKPNGDSNLRMFDENSSTVYGYIKVGN